MPVAAGEPFGHQHAGPNSQAQPRLARSGAIPSKKCEVGGGKGKGTQRTPNLIHPSIFFTLELRPQQSADRLLCLAVVTQHHLLSLRTRTRLFRARRTGVAHGVSPHNAAGPGADPASRVTSAPGSAASAASGGSSCCCRVPGGLPWTGVRVKNFSLVMFGWAPPLLGGERPKIYLSTSCSRWAARSWICPALRLANVLRKGVFESHLPHGTAVPTLVIARPTRL
eukprot:359839-Chlamydomonas_euryale.AAC.10